MIKQSFLHYTSFLCLNHALHAMVIMHLMLWYFISFVMK